MQLLEGLQPSGSPLRLEQVEDLAKILPGNQLYIIENGLLHAQVDDRPLFYLQKKAIWLGCARASTCQLPLQQRGSN